MCLFVCSSNQIKNTCKSVNIVGLRARSFKGRNDKGESNTFKVLMCSRKWKDSVIVYYEPRSVYATSFANFIEKKKHDQNLICNIRCRFYHHEASHRTTQLENTGITAVINFCRKSVFRAKKVVYTL